MADSQYHSLRQTLTNNIFNLEHHLSNSQISLCKHTHRLTIGAIFFQISSSSCGVLMHFIIDYQFSYSYSS